MATENAGLGLTSPVADGGVAHILDTEPEYTSGKLLSLRNDGDEQFSVDFEGNVVGGSYTGTSGVFSGDVVAEVIRRDTLNAADDDVLELTGGGANSTARGAHIRLFGNEHATGTGSTEIFAGNVAGGAIRFYTADTVRAAIAADLTVDGSTSLSLMRRASGVNALVAVQWKDGASLVAGDKVLILAG